MFNIMEVPMLAQKKYTTKIDSKKRLTLRGAKYDYYKVREYDNGFITLEPQELVSPLKISEKTLECMDKAVENYKAGKVSEEIDLSEFLDK